MEEARGREGEQEIRALLVEDDPDDALLLRMMLAEETRPRFRLVHAATLPEALELLSEQRFDVVLSDLLLPGSRDLEAFNALHQHSPQVPIVVLTGLDDEALAMRAVQEGAQDYLVKGHVARQLLVRSLRYALERQRSLQYQALITERERFDAAISLMSDGILVTDGEWRLVIANHAAALLLDLPESWQGLRLEEALRPFKLSVEAGELRSAAERVSAFEVARLHTRPTLLIDARLTRLWSPSGGLASTVLTLRDVTTERMEQKVRADFFSMISHKLRMPLALISSYLYLLRSLTAASGGGRLQELVQASQLELDRLGRMVKTLLDFKALAASELEEQTLSSEVGPAIAWAAEETRRRYPQRMVEVTVEVPPEVPRAAASPEHLAFVLEKLLDNAIKFADKDPVRLDVRVDPEGEAWLCFTVSDNGPGIPHEYLDRVLEGFVQVEDRHTGQVPGLGLGLYMARQVVEAYGGRLRVRSRLGEGTRVSFTLPARPATARSPAGVG